MRLLLICLYACPFIVIKRKFSLNYAVEQISAPFLMEKMYYAQHNQAVFGYQIQSLTNL